MNVEAQDLAGNTATFRVTLTTELAPEAAGWPPGTIFATQTKVTNANQLPAGCEPFTTACWQQSVADGTVKFLDAGGAQRENRPLVYACFRRADGAQNADQSAAVVCASCTRPSATRKLMRRMDGRTMPTTLTASTSRRPPWASPVSRACAASLRSSSSLRS
jgi:hypothetical protein